MAKKLINLTPENIRYISDMAYQNRGKNCIQGNFGKEVNKIVDYYKMLKK